MEDLEALKKIDKKLSAILYLLIYMSDVSITGIKKKQFQKIEIVLENIGLEAQEIAEILDKKITAVQKALQRARKS